MQLSKLLGGLVAFGIALLAVGSVATLATETLGTTERIATVVLVATFVVGLSAAGIRSRDWLAGPYW